MTKAQDYCQAYNDGIILLTCQCAANTTSVLYALDILLEYFPSNVSGLIELYTERYGFTYPP